MEKESLKDFNHKVKEMLKMIIHAAPPDKLNDLKYFWLDMEAYKDSSDFYYDKNKIVCCSSKEEDFNNSPEPEWTFGYYWAEFTYPKGPYKICMFYKDIDNKKGNVHVFPGFVQVKEKREKTEDECFVEVTRAICPKDIRTPYYEEGWGPIFSGIASNTIKMVWNPEQPCVPADFWKDFPNHTPSTESAQSDKEYGWVCADKNSYNHICDKDIDYLIDMKHAQGMYKTLYGWKDDKKHNIFMTHYKFVYIKKEGYFIVFENKPHYYPENHNKKLNETEFVLCYAEVDCNGKPLIV